MDNKNSVKEEIRITGFKSVYYFEHGKEFYHAPEQHDYWEIVYVDKGEIIAVTDGIGNLAFIKFDGTVRPYHEVYNEF